MFMLILFLTMRRDFYDTLKKRGINVTLRQEQGHDIDAACGQLRSKKMNNNLN